jgi:dipeptidyl aminopeptidase/acylaminoacyl peptidase
MLPGADWVLFTVAKGRTLEDWDQAQIVAQSISSGERRVVVENARDARYLASGHLVFARGGLVFAARFDARRVEVTSSTVAVLEGVRRSEVDGTAHFSVSGTGSLIYLPGPTELGERRVDLVLADRNGAAERVPLPPGPYDHPRVSPDGRLLAFGTTGEDQDIWIYDLAGSTAARRLTFGGKSRFPIWSADGRRVAFQSDREGDTALYWQVTDGSSPAVRLTRPDRGTTHIPDAWLPGEDRFLFSVVRGSTRTLWTFSVRDRKSEPFDRIQGSNSPSLGPTVSPDGKWIAYTASDPITAEGRGIFVQPFPPTGATYQISERSQGHKPLWSLDGREIFFVAVVGQLTVVRIGPGPGFTFSKPTNFQRGFTEHMGPAYERNYDMTHDGRFIGLAAPGQGQNIAPTGHINVIVNWTEELNRLVPAS